MEIEMISPAGRVVVPEGEVDLKIAQGWTLPAKPVEKKTKKTVVKEEE